MAGMSQRGVTRPMALRERDEARQSGDGLDRQELLHEHHRQTLWVYWTLILLGVWTMAAPFNFGYGQHLAMPAGGRSVWLALDTRVQISIWNDVVCGLLLVILGWRSLLPGRPVSLWLACGVGTWLNLAPVIFWAPTAAAYVNDTMVGVLVIALTILIPGMPSMITYMKMGPDQPPGWSFNPSSWPQRAIMIGAGFAGWLVSRHLAMFQLGYIDHVFEPFFGDGSRLVLTSKMSESLPVSDGALGAFAYTFEFLMGWMGAPSRWRTMPWMVTFFGILVIPLGLVHIFLVASQPVVVGHWCTMCLLAATIMLPMIPLEVDEVIAMMQFLGRKRREGAPLWRTFWKGGNVDDGGPDERTPPMMSFPRQPRRVTAAMFWGLTAPLNLVATTAIGLWLMGAPAVLGTGKPLMDVVRIAGALTITVSVVSMGEPLRLGRYLLIPVGLALAVAPFVVGGGGTTSLVDAVVSGLLVAGLGLPRGRVQERYAGWDRFVR